MSTKDYIRHIEKRIEKLRESHSIPKYYRILFVEEELKPCASINYTYHDDKEKKEELKKRISEEDRKVLEKNMFKTVRSSYETAGKRIYEIYLCRSTDNHNLDNLVGTHDGEISGKMFGYPKKVRKDFVNEKRKRYSVPIHYLCIDSILRNTFNYEDLIAACSNDYIIYPSKERLKLTVERGYKKFEICERKSEISYELLLAHSASKVLPFKEYMRDTKRIIFQGNEVIINEEDDILVNGKKYKNYRSVNPNNLKLPIRN